VNAHRFGWFRSHVRRSSEPVTAVKIAVDVPKLAA
jgi:hypothetical protein